MAHWQRSISKQPHLRQLLYHSLTEIHIKATTPQTATVPLSDRDPFLSNHTSDSYCTALWQRSISKQPHLRQLLYRSLTEIHFKATTSQGTTVPLTDRSISKQPHLRQLLYHSLTEIRIKATTSQTATVPLTDRSISKQPHLRQLLYRSLTEIHFKAVILQAGTGLQPHPVCFNDSSTNY